MVLADTLDQVEEVILCFESPKRFYHYECWILLNALGAFLCIRFDLPILRWRLLYLCLSDIFFCSFPFLWCFYLVLIQCNDDPMEWVRVFFLFLFCERDCGELVSFLPLLFVKIHQWNHLDMMLSFYFFIFQNLGFWFLVYLLF